MTSLPAADIRAGTGGRPAPRQPVRSAGWPVPIALVGLSLIPLTAGMLRLVQLAGGPQVIPADDRFPGLPAALIIHIVGATLYALIGVLQFVPRFRRRHLTWHRRMGRLLTIAGLLVAATALWMTVLYAPKPGTGELLYVLRLVVGTGTVACLVLGIAAVRRRDIAAHRGWMIRAYAIGLAAGTQAFTEGIAGALAGNGELTGDLAKGAGWVINLAIVEAVIRRSAAPHAPPRTRRAGPVPADRSHR